jgi:hypothetical protein
MAGSLRVEQSASVSGAMPKIVAPSPEESDDETDDLAPPVRPAVRLVPTGDQEEGVSAVPFPWSPSPDRPQRTPPRRSAPEQAPSASDLPQSVKLTAEELEALLGKPASREERG